MITKWAFILLVLTKKERILTNAAELSSIFIQSLCASATLMFIEDVEISRGNITGQLHWHLGKILWLVERSLSTLLNFLYSFISIFIAIIITCFLTFFEWNTNFKLPWKMNPHNPSPTCHRLLLFLIFNFNFNFNLNVHCNNTMMLCFFFHLKIQ